MFGNSVGEFHSSVRLHSSIPITCSDTARRVTASSTVDRVLLPPVLVFGRVAGCAKGPMHPCHRRRRCRARSTLAQTHAHPNAHLLLSWSQRLTISGTMDSAFQPGNERRHLRSSFSPVPLSRKVTQRFAVYEPACLQRHRKNRNFATLRPIPIRGCPFELSNSV